ncbi:succinate dehydrogenase [ubiquinone] cytochrome b small subunit [Plakobranchus ocellatus]|uniref:Succinate dehydrogenase [ubiquinone] cytochrome b small subunit n=1 Tax=Plakobranchus ocellatus TaxID=259542 RepID=A0AAV4DQ37_9GAST|nr:succinate dehydrogenase [ubiquinone] cytochrome b small subunit [Plakobranchus ocellatus]
MATSILLRACSRGSRSLLLQMRPLPSYARTDVLSKHFTASPALGTLEYFRARRGPFTPEEKRGKGHMMMASTHWKVERFVAIAMVGIMPACLFVQGSTMDHLLTTFVYLHGFWGIDGVLKDYLVKFVPWVEKVWYLLAIIGFAGLVNFNFNDVGITKAIQMLWSL